MFTKQTKNFRFFNNKYFASSPSFKYFRYDVFFQKFIFLTPIGTLLHCFTETIIEILHVYFHKLFTVVKLSANFLFTKILSNNCMDKSLKDIYSLKQYTYTSTICPQSITLIFMKLLNNKKINMKLVGVFLAHILI